MTRESLGIDLGGTKIEGIRMGADGEVLHRHRVPTEQEGGYEHILGRIAQMVGELETTGEGLPLGIGTPGSLSARDGLLKNSNTQCLNGQPIHEDLEKRLGRKIHLENDANCFALAEARLGAGRDASVAFGVILGTGIGGGIILSGRIWSGPQHIAGEWGHHKIIADGPLCYCGGRGCVESLLSGPALAENYRTATGKIADAEGILEALRDGDSAAKEIFSTWIGHFGVAMANVINILDPDAVILGGGLSNIDEIYQLAPAAIAANLFNDELRTPILRHHLGDSAGVLGAALLAKSTDNG